MTVQILTGDCRDALEYMPSASIHSIVTDPPYALVSITKRFGKPGSAPAKDVYHRAAAGFMGKQWDTGETAFDPAFWADALRVLKPGGHVLAFGGTRTYHRLASAIEDAGFEIRDQIGWLYGSGFPKSHNQDGDWEGWGTALKPGWEPIVMARKPLDGTVAGNLAEWGVGALNIDGCRVPTDDIASRAGGRRPSTHEGYQRPGATMFQDKSDWSLPDNGRWPANVIHDGSDEVLDAFPHTKSGKPGVMRLSENTGAAYGAESRAPGTPMTGFGDEGSAARFFYCAKASRADRNDGLDAFEAKPLLWSAGTQNPGSFQSEHTDKSAKNNHPTVKPTDLMRYLCRLVTPPGGTVLDPFMGSGSTGRGAVLEGFNFIGCEMEAEYVAIARARIAAVSEKTNDTDIFA